VCVFNIELLYIYIYIYMISNTYYMISYTAVI
jgi:hypothetical protein